MIEAMFSDVTDPRSSRWGVGTIFTKTYSGSWHHRVQAAATAQHKVRRAW